MDGAGLGEGGWIQGGGAGLVGRDWPTVGVAWHVESVRAGWGSSRQEGRAGPGGRGSRGCLVSPGPTRRPRTVWGYLPVSVSIRLFLSGFDCVSWTVGLPDPTYSTIPIRLYHPGMIVL